MIKYSIQYIYKSAYIYMTTCPFNYVEDCRAADVLQKCAGKNVHNCKKWKRARDIKLFKICIDMTTCLSNYMEWCRCIAKVHKYKCAYLRKKKKVQIAKDIILSSNWKSAYLWLREKSAHTVFNPNATVRMFVCTDLKK